jgi:septal ring factor EnvC (AmiA/AmiB activator)
VPPAEKTASAERFRLPLDAGQEAALAVREVRPTQTSISIGELTDQYIASGMRQGMFTEELLRALKPVIDKRVELAGVARPIEALDSREKAIETDQNRLRENMKALRGSAEEKQLLQRYTRQLNDQEDKLEALRKNKEQAESAQAKLRAEMHALIEKASFEGGKS